MLKEILRFLKWVIFLMYKMLYLDAVSSIFLQLITIIFKNNKKFSLNVKLNNEIKIIYIYILLNFVWQHACHRFIIPGIENVTSN